jgi:hypothetical protein
MGVGYGGSGGFGSFSPKIREIYSERTTQNLQSHHIQHPLLANLQFQFLKNTVTQLRIGP